MADQNQEPVVVDWRAPVAEPFYRATGREPMGLARRRHFATRGRTLLGIEDELFGERALDLGQAAHDDGISGHGALISALETARTGRLGDIVATIQGEQDEIIRAPLPGVLVVQGGPGTGKTVVALHRAAYLLYTHRFPLEDQGVLVVGPNRLFLAYIEQVLPSLGEAGVELAVLADLVDTVRGAGQRPTARGPGQGRRAHGQGAQPRPCATASARCATTCGCGSGLQTLVVERRAERPHRRRRPPPLPQPQRRSALRRAAAVRGAGRSQPRAARRQRRPRPPAPHPGGPRGARVDVAGAHAGRAAARPVRLPQRCCARPAAASSPTRRSTRSTGPVRRRPTTSSGPSTTCRCSTRPAPCSGRRRGPSGGARTTRSAPTATSSSTRRRTSRPCSCACSTRRSLNGSMTVVGDIAQSTGAWAHADWDEVLRLPARSPAGPPGRAHRRLPHPGAEHGARGPGAGRGRARPRAAAVGPRGRTAAGVRAVARRTSCSTRSPRRCATSVDAVGAGNVAVICPASMVDAVSARRSSGPASTHGVALAAGPRPPGHGRAGGPGEGPRARRHGRGRAGGHRRRGAAGHAGALRRPHPGHQASSPSCTPAGSRPCSRAPTPYGPPAMATRARPCLTRIRPRSAWPAWPSPSATTPVLVDVDLAVGPGDDRRPARARAGAARPRCCASSPGSSGPTPAWSRVGGRLLVGRRGLGAARAAAGSAWCSRTGRCSRT